MRKKVGIYLEAVPKSGGMFQYNQTLIDALDTLTAKYEIVYAYKSKIWEEYLINYTGNKIELQSNIVGKIIRKSWQTIGLSIEKWRTISHPFLPEVKALIKQNADLWIFPPQDLMTYQSKNIQAIGTIHDIMHRYERSFPEISTPKEYNYREELLSNISKFSKAIFVDSQYGKMQLMETYSTDAGKIFPLPYIAPKYIYQNKPIDNFESRYKLPKKFVFYPAQFWMHKNHIRLVNAIHLLKKDIPDIALVLVGSKNNSYNKVIGEVERLGLENNVYFMGYVPNEDIPEFYKRARALIMPTFFGPTNIPPLEAFVLGCPVGISGIYGMPEQLGDAALLFDPKSVDSIANVIRRLWIEDEICATLISRGKLKAATWGQQQFTERFIEIIFSILSK